MTFLTGRLSLSLMGAAFLAAIPAFLATKAQQAEPTAYASHAQAEAKRAPADFVPDGDLSKVVWKNAKWAEFDHSSSGKANHPEISTRVAAAWSEKYIYFAFSCKYETLNIFENEDIAKERWELWNRDVAEVFLNPQQENITHYYEFEVAPNNQWIDLEIEKKNKPFNDAGWNSGFEHATKIDAKNQIWTAEMRIPLSSMKVTSVGPGIEWRVNYFRAAGPGPDSQRKFLAWSIIPNGDTFHVPSRFGILRLVK